GVFTHEIERQQGMTQMVEHTQEQDDVEASERADIVDGKLAELDLRISEISGEACLRKIFVVEIDAENPRRTAPFHLDGVKAGVAANVQNGLASKIAGKRM